MHIVTISWLLIFMLEAAFLVQIYSLDTRVSSLKESLEQHFGMNMASKEIQPNLQNGQLELCDCQVNNGLLVSL